MSPSNVFFNSFWKTIAEQAISGFGDMVNACLKDHFVVGFVLFMGINLIVDNKKKIE